ncbi:23210_t:CDS:2, partial [Gigaspora rosea]
HADGHKHLHIKVLDKDLVSDDEIGEGKVDLSKISGGFLETWVELPRMLGLRSNGKVHMILETAQ